MPYDHETVCLALGMLLGMFYYQKTGWACGGIITPGVIAMYIGDPAKIGVSIAAGLLTWLILDGFGPFLQPLWSSAAGNRHADSPGAALSTGIFVG